MSLSMLQRFLKLESSSSILLFLAAVLAMVLANSPLRFLHQQFVNTFIFWINEVLMSFFFLLVGLELKRSFLQGHLRQLSQIALPAVAALGGMVIPALIYLYINAGNPVTLPGWSTPVATDVAFALGTLSLFGRRIPVELKLFLLALAIFDDIGAILIIAFYYSQALSYSWLFFSLVIFGSLFLLNFYQVEKLFWYLLGGIGLWICLLQAGIHPTIAGVLLALMIPNGNVANKSLLQTLEDFLHPWVAYLIMPLFALANAGFSLQDVSWHHLSDTVVLGISLGLFLGKQLGVFSFSWCLIRLKLANLPAHSSWLMLYGVAILCGIGFTMSLFLGTLSFENESIYLAEVRLGVILGSLLSGLLGAAVLLISFVQKRSSVID